MQVLLDNNCDRYDVVNINFLLLFFTIVVVVSFVADKGLLTSMAYIQTTVPPSPKATIKH